MTGRQKKAAPDAPAADPQPVPEAAPDTTSREVLLRAGHRHRGVHYAEVTPYRAAPEEIELLRRYGALVER